MERQHAPQGIRVPSSSNSAQEQPPEGAARPTNAAAISAAKRFLVGRGPLSEIAAVGLHQMLPVRAPRILAAHARGARLGADIAEGHKLSMGQLVEHPEFDWGPPEPAGMLKKAKLRRRPKTPWDLVMSPQTSPIGAQWHSRAERSGDPEQSRSTRTVAETGADLSPREEALHKRKDPAWNRDVDAVMWEEGMKYWVINERDRWVQVHRDISAPIGAGPSGTTNTFMQAAQALKVDRHDTRTACIAYLLPARHHTLVEILEAAAPYGCSYTAGAGMYRDIRPFTESELRACGNGGLFPDESGAVAA